jgi:hypothetical protein
MKSSLTTFAFFFETILGSVAVATILAAPFDLTLKVAACCLMLLFSGMHDLQSVQQSSYFDATVHLIDAAARTLQLKIEGRSDADWNKALDEYLRKAQVLDIAGGSGRAYVSVFLLKYGLWFSVGVILAKFVLPDVLRRFA